jgi:hypothetical protein
LGRIGAADPPSSRKAAEYEDAKERCQFAPAGGVTAPRRFRCRQGKIVFLPLKIAFPGRKSIQINILLWRRRIGRQRNFRCSAAEWQRNLPRGIALPNSVVEAILLIDIIT